MIYCFDIDGTICTDTKGKYRQAKPYPKVIEKINRLSKNNHTIILLTARGSMTGIDWEDVTKKQLAKWQVKYDKLFFGKPPADIFVDDKAINAVDFFRKAK